MDAIYLLGQKLVTGKDAEGPQEGYEDVKDAAEECPHKKAKKFDRRHCNDKDTWFSAYDMGEPAEVARAAVLNSGALHPEHLLHTGTEEVPFLKSGCHQPPPPFPFL